MPRRSNWWLTGIGVFTALLFGTLSFFSYKTYTFRADNYYLISTLVYGGVAAFSIVAVIAGWRNALPGQRRESAAEDRADSSLHQE